MRELIEILILAAVILMRLWSRKEHKQTGTDIKRDITEIKLYINGELQERLEKAREQGRQEEREKIKKDSL